MLIEFRVTNFRSFRDLQIFSMVAGAGSEHRETHSFEAPTREGQRLLASAALYGPNAAGKTNLLKALQCMQSVVVNSASSYPASAPIAYSPFKFDVLTHEAPTQFEVAFIESGTRYEYCFSLDATRVHHERLTAYHSRNPTRLFDRTYNRATEKYEWTFSSSLKGNRSVWRDATRPNALFLSTAIQLNSTQLLPVFWWFQKRLVIIFGNTMMNFTLTLKLLNQPDGKDRLLPFIREADFGIADLHVTPELFTPQQLSLFQGPAQPLIYQDDPMSPPKIAKVRFSHTVKGADLPAELDMAEESSGTQMLFRTGGAWLNVLLNGEILLVDEIDTSLHPLLVSFLIGRFHSRSTNRQNAQLIFTTHNTSILNLKLFRRDQIWFVEKGVESTSKLYPLSDFSPRKDEVVNEWYMRGRYGALPILEDIDAQ